MKNEIKSPIEFVREIVRSALWDVVYHEQELTKAHEKLGNAKKIMENATLNCEETDDPEEDADGEPIITSVEQLICNFLNNARDSVEHHEENLTFAHGKVAFAKIMLARGNYTEIDLTEVQKEVDEQLKKRSLTSGGQP